jgi:hypothetical protein
MRWVQHQSHHPHPSEEPKRICKTSYTSVCPPELREVRSIYCQCYVHVRLAGACRICAGASDCNRAHKQVRKRRYKYHHTGISYLIYGVCARGRIRRLLGDIGAVPESGGDGDGQGQRRPMHAGEHHALYWYSRHRFGMLVSVHHDMNQSG